VDVCFSSFLTARVSFGSTKLSTTRTLSRSSSAAASGISAENGHIYNDGGALGGFGELECFGQTIGGDTYRTASSDPMILWLYVGPEEQIEDISLHLLGVKAKAGVRERTDQTMQ
jgi:hypothetical protein